MPTTDDSTPTPEKGTGSAAEIPRWKKVRLRLAEIVTAAVIIPLVTWCAIWLVGKVNPEEHLSAVVQIPSPAHSCSGGDGWVFEKDPQHLPGVLPNDDKDAWAAANEGIPASGNYIVVTLQGLNGHTVVVDSITVNVVSRTEPPHGTYPNTGAQCGGLRPYRFQFDLDTMPVSVTALADGGVVMEGQERRPVDLPHAISGSAPEIWHLGVITDTCTCEWTATLNWTSDGEPGHTEIDDNGKSFRVAATTHATHVFTDFKGGWIGM